MKIGMNEPCPCGSGKKYKKCCWEKEYQEKRFFDDLNKLYAPIKYLNNELLKKSNIPYYVGATFNDAIQLTITSNALSLIKGVMQKNYRSITNALNVRNIIECLTLVIMDTQGDITQDQKDLFIEQYKLIEYESYASDGGEKFECMLDLQDLTARYEEAKAKFIKSGVTEKKLKRVANSRLPFLCKEYISFNELIEKYCPDLIDGYIELSQMIHPVSYSYKRNYEQYDALVFIVLHFLRNLYKDRDRGNVLTFKEEEVLLYCGGLKFKENYSERLYDLQKAQWEELLSLSKDLKGLLGGNNYISDFIGELVLVMHDLNTDSQLGYTENVKLKFKVIAEMLACFNKVYFGFLKTEEVNYYGKMLKKHELIKIYERCKEIVPQDLKDEIYKSYIKNFINSNLSEDQFFKAFDKPLGFLIDECGVSPTYTALVKEFFEILYKDEIIHIEKYTEGRDVKLKDYFSLVYKESNNMSHGCGYLFFTNTGAWMDDINIIHFLDVSILNILQRISIAFFAFGIDNEMNSKVADRLKKSIDILDLLFKEKIEILKIPRVSKFY